MNSGCPLLSEMKFRSANTVCHYVVIPKSKYSDVDLCNPDFDVMVLYCLRWLAYRTTKGGEEDR